MAMGSRRTTPTWPVMAAVVSVLIAEPRKTPCAQSKASNTSGITLERREPKMKAEIGTPCGSSQFGAIDGHCWARTVKREFGCAAGVPGFHGWPCQSTRPAGGSGVSPSHHGSPDGVTATLVKIVLLFTMAVAFGFVFGLVLGATPKKPFSGLMARSWPVASTWIHAMSSPTVHTRLPRAEAQRVALLAEQRIAAVAGAHAPDQLLFWEL